MKKALSSDKLQNLLVSILLLLDALEVLFLRQRRAKEKSLESGGKEAGEGRSPKMNPLLFLRPLCHHQLHYNWIC